MVNNQTPCVIVKIIAVYDYIYNVIDYDWIASGNAYCDYLKSCNRLKSITITSTLLYSDLTQHQLWLSVLQSKVLPFA